MTYAQIKNPNIQRTESELFYFLLRENRNCAKYPPQDVGEYEITKAINHQRNYKATAADPPHSPGNHQDAPSAVYETNGNI